MIWNSGESGFPTNPTKFKVIFYSWFYFVEDLKILVAIDNFENEEN